MKPKYFDPSPAPSNHHSWTGQQNTCVFDPERAIHFFSNLRLRGTNSSHLLCIQRSTAPVYAETYARKMPTEPHHLQKAKTGPCYILLHNYTLQIISMNSTNRISDSRHPWWSPTRNKLN
ncbi:hypothetical protein AMECASPLE_032338 [Ameca splendens]|uniref:Uncharacterized protein n=1 Tax=Ameca splendens TaxID=208324 RepID=A0ABV0YUV7_9TELE